MDHQRVQDQLGTSSTPFVFHRQEVMSLTTDHCTVTGEQLQLPQSPAPLPLHRVARPRGAGQHRVPDPVRQDGPGLRGPLAIHWRHRGALQVRLGKSRRKSRSRSGRRTRRRSGRRSGRRSKEDQEKVREPLVVPLLLTQTCVCLCVCQCWCGPHWDLHGSGPGSAAAGLQGNHRPLRLCV